MTKRAIVVATMGLVLLGLGACSASAATSARLDSLRVKAFRQCDIPDAGTQKITTAVGNDAINLAITWVCANGPAIERFDTIWTSSDPSGVALNSDFNRVATAMMVWTDTVSGGPLPPYYIPLQEISPDSLRAVLSTLMAVKAIDPKSPFQWKYFRTFGGRFLIYPMWDRSDSMQIALTYYANDTLLQSNASQTSVRQKFLDAVIEYAAYKLSRKRNNLDDAVQSLNAARMYFGMPPVTKEQLLEK